LVDANYFIKISKKQANGLVHPIYHRLQIIGSELKQTNKLKMLVYPIFLLVGLWASMSNSFYHLTFFFCKRMKILLYFLFS